MVDFVMLSRSQLVVSVRRESQQRRQIASSELNAPATFKLDKTTSTFSYTASLMGGSGYQTLWKAEDIQGLSSEATGEARREEKVGEGEETSEARQVRTGEGCKTGLYMESDAWKVVVNAPTLPASAMAWDAV